MSETVHPMIEKCARAACLANGGQPDQRFYGEDTEAEWEMFIPDVLAVLRTLKEPDQGMRSAMYDAATNRVAITYGDAFTAAIDSVLFWEEGK